MSAVLDQLKAEGYPVDDADVAHLWPARYAHINPYGKYRFNVDEELGSGEQRSSYGTRSITAPLLPLPQTRLFAFSVRGLRRWQSCFDLSTCVGEQHRMQNDEQGDQAAKSVPVHKFYISSIIFSGSR
jgi:rRNA maturation protein Nop10